MIVIDLPPIDFPKPAIIRPAPDELLRYGGDPALAVHPSSPNVVAAGGGKKLGLGFNDHETSSGASIDMVAGVKAGQLLVLVDYAVNSGSSPIPTNVVPSGFTQAATNGNNAARLTFSYRRTDGTEGASLTGMNGGSNNAKILLLFGRGIKNLVAASWVANVSTGTPSDQTVTSGSGDPPLVVIGAQASRGTSDSNTFSGSTDDFDDELVETRLRVGYRVYSESPANHVVGWGSGGSNLRALGSGYISAS